MKYDKWNVAPPRPKRRAALEQAGFSPLLSAVLAARGVEGAEEARALLDAGAEPLVSPFLMRDMDKAAARLRLALERGETVAVYGDYDVDGITSTCLLTDFLRGLGGSVIPYIPDRLEEGYGLSCQAVTTLKERGASLIVTVDCGITALDEVDLANRLGMDVIITDHHECKEVLPAAAAVADPHRPDCPYPFKGLAGVGVALKLACAVAGDQEGILERYADLAAVGTVADVMPMTGENRTIVRRGLERLGRAPRLGFELLIREAGLGERNLTSVSIGYILAPRINASGRMGRADLAVELLLTRDQERGAEVARQLCELNRQRQSIEADIFEQCVELLEREPQPGAVVLVDSRWHQGVVGIVASRLCERYGCPVFMICLSEDGLGKGSCRSWGELNLFQMLSGCSDLLESFGGHALAAGFTVRAENIPQLARRLREESLQAAGLGEGCTLEADAVVQPQELTVEGIESLDALEPCGSGNPRPVLALSGAAVQAMSQVGRGRHLKLRLESRGRLLDAIWFSTDGAQLGLAPGCRVDVAFYPQVNEFRGVRSPQLQVLDLRPSLTRAQSERAIYEKYTLGTPLTAEEARMLLPTRAEFVGLWRYLQRACAGREQVEDTALRLARGAARAAGRRETVIRTQVCLEVLEERGLIRLSRRQDSFVISLNRPQHKVDLEASAIMRDLRRLAEDFSG